MSACEDTLRSTAVAVAAVCSMRFSYHLDLALGYCIRAELASASRCSLFLRPPANQVLPSAALLIAEL